MELSRVSLCPAMAGCKLALDPGLATAGYLSAGSGPGTKSPLLEGVWLQPEAPFPGTPTTFSRFANRVSASALAQFRVCRRRCVLCVHLLTEPRQMRVKRLRFKAADRFNHILQNVLKFRWHFSASQHFSAGDTVSGLAFRSDPLDPSGETRKPSSQGSRSVPAYTDTKRPVQLS